MAEEEQTATPEPNTGENRDASGREEGVDEPREVAPAIVRKVRVKVRFVGTDGEWGSSRLTLIEGASAWDATRQALTDSDLTYRTGTAATEDVLVLLTRTSDGFSLAWDPTSGSAWHLYINDEHYQGFSSTPQLEDGDVIEWRYELGRLTVSVSVVGPGGSGYSYWIEPTNIRMYAQQTVWDASVAVFAQNGYSKGRLLSYQVSDDGSVALRSLAALGENGITGEAWQVFVNGSTLLVDAGHAALSAGDSICWYYCGRGVRELPAFVALSGAASPNPADAVDVAGAVVRRWTFPESALAHTAGVVDVLDASCGVAVAGGTTPVLVRVPDALLDPVAALAGVREQSGSISGVLGARLFAGEGGRAVYARSDTLCYLDANGRVTRLDLLRDEAD